VAYAAYLASSGDERESLDHVTERPEVLVNLWFASPGHSMDVRHCTTADRTHMPL
jgi:hypothetical protein